MIGDLSSLDIVAVAVFFVVWFGYSLLFQGRFKLANSINARMMAVREEWMVRFLERDNRIMDAQLNSSSIRTASFFASATIIIVGALVGVLGAAERVRDAAPDLSALLPRDSQGLFELKLVLLAGIFIFAFFKFSWAIRLFNHFSAVMGAAPLRRDGPVDRPLAKRMALIRSHAVWQLNSGLRAYYFALAALGWFIHPLLFMAMTVLMAGVMLWRQLWSGAARTIADHADHLADGA